MRDLDEAIKHCYEVAEEQRQRSELYDEWSTEDEGKIEECLECAKEHEQLAEWLEELKAFREAKEDIDNLELSPMEEDSCGIALCRGIIDGHLSGAEKR